MRALFIPCSVDGLSPNSGSILFRAKWMAKYWPEGEAQVYDGTQRPGDFEVVVFQKVYRSERMRGWLLDWRENRGYSGRDRTLVLDMCDPDWLSPATRERLLDVIHWFDMATCPTAPLCEWLGQYLPTYLVEDGVDLDAMTHHHTFSDTAEPSVCWIGYPGNLAALGALAADIQRTGLPVQVIEIEKAVNFETFLRTLVQYDVLLNPRPAEGLSRYKSNNKSTVAWAAGVAVAENPGDLLLLRDPDYRRERLAVMAMDVRTVWSARRSAQALFAAVRQEREHGPRAG